MNSLRRKWSFAYKKVWSSNEKRNPQQHFPIFWKTLSRCLLWRPTFTAYKHCFVWKTNQRADQHYPGKIIKSYLDFLGKLKLLGNPKTPQFKECFWTEQLQPSEQGPHSIPRGSFQEYPFLPSTVIHTSFC